MKRRSPPNGKPRIFTHPAAAAIPSLLDTETEATPVEEDEKDVQKASEFFLPGSIPDWTTDKGRLGVHHGYLPVFDADGNIERWSPDQGSLSITFPHRFTRYHGLDGTGQPRYTLSGGWADADTMIRGRQRAEEAAGRPIPERDDAWEQELIRQIIGTDMHESGHEATSAEINRIRPASHEKPASLLSVLRERNRRPSDQISVYRGADQGANYIGADTENLPSLRYKQRGGYEALLPSQESAFDERAAFTAQFPFHPNAALARWLNHRNVGRNERQKIRTRLGVNEREARMATEMGPIGIREDFPDPESSIHAAEMNELVSRFLIPAKDRVQTNLIEAVLGQVGDINLLSGDFLNDEMTASSSSRGARMKAVERQAAPLVNAIRRHFRKLPEGEYPKTLADLPEDIRMEIGRLELRRKLASMVGQERFFSQHRRPLNAAQRLDQDMKVVNRETGQVWDPDNTDDMPAFDMDEWEVTVPKSRWQMGADKWDEYPSQDPDLFALIGEDDYGEYDNRRYPRMAYEALRRNLRRESGGGDDDYVKYKGPSGTLYGTLPLPRHFNDPVLLSILEGYRDLDRSEAGTAIRTAPGRKWSGELASGDFGSERTPGDRWKMGEDPVIAGRHYDLHDYATFSGLPALPSSSIIDYHRKYRSAPRDPSRLSLNQILEQIVDRRRKEQMKEAMKEW